MSIINYKFIEGNIDDFKSRFKDGVIECAVIDGFLYPEAAIEIYKEFPDPLASALNKSRDYIFAKNKYEKSNLTEAGDYLSKLKEELLSARFQRFLKNLTGEDVFIDPDFHGGGLHQGGTESYLNMHADFNYHPLKKNWFRNLNVLIYMNPGWKEEFGGKLKLKNAKTGLIDEIEPLFNRCVIMFTRDYTLHGYDKLSFPEGMYRRSIAAYAYSITENNNDERSTVWYPDDGGVIKKIIGKSWPKLVALKSKFWGSSTGKNK